MKSLKIGVVTVLWAVACAALISGNAQAGAIVVWGSNSYSLVDNTPEGEDFVAVAAGDSHNVALREDGSIVGWGLNTSSQVTLPDSNDFSAISAGTAFTLALNKNGTIEGWGTDTYNQITDIPDTNDFTAISAGSYHCTALRSDGSLAAWGRNNSGQINVPAGTTFTAVASGGFFSLALNYDGTISAWGDNSYHQVDYAPTDPNYIAIAAGLYHCLALRDDGSVEAWGNNSYNQCNVPAGNDFVAVAAGEYHSLALRQDGTVEAFGNNNKGQTDVPTDVFFGAIEGGDEHSIAIIETGSITLLNPSAGESLQTGQIYTINWEAEGNFQNVWLDYSTDGGANWLAVSPQNKGNTGSYDWVVPIAHSQNCLIRAKSSPSLYISDVTDAFTIYVCSLQADITGDCVVNIDDYALMAVEWLMADNPFEPEVPAASFDGDYDVDMDDFAIFAATWLIEQGQPGYNANCDIGFLPDGVIDMIDLIGFVQFWGNN